MRRARFARAVEKVGTAPERASVGEALWFDVRSSDSAGDDSLLASRVSGLDHTAIVLAATHQSGLASTRTCTELTDQPRDENSR